jgi:hypothetical protein
MVHTIKDFLVCGVCLSPATLFMKEERPTKCIFKVNHIFRISVLLLHFSALQERHLQGAQKILMKLCVCYVISAKIEIK